MKSLIHKAANTEFSSFCKFPSPLLVILPYLNDYSTLAEPYGLVGRQLGVEPMPHYAIFNGLLLVLFVLHIYWSYLILLVTFLILF
jgi:hypothetical protein